MPNRLLLVEDDPAVRRSLADTLAEEGFEVRACETAESALGELGELRPEVVLTDVRMPGMDGLELLKMLRERAPSIDVVLMTAYDDMPTVALPASPGGMPRLASFTPDGQALLLLRVPEAGSEVRELVRLPLEGGPAEAVGLAMEWLGGVHVDPSGERLVFAAGGRGQELWVMSEFLPEAQDGSAERERP